MRIISFLLVLITFNLSSQEIKKVDSERSTINYTGKHFLHKWSAENKNISDEYTPELFSEEKKIFENESDPDTKEEMQTQKLFDQNSTDEEEFEIPAFLRKQKF